MVGEQLYVENNKNGNRRIIMLRELENKAGVTFDNSFFDNSNYLSLTRF